MNKLFKKKTGKCYICKKRGHDAKECKNYVFIQFKKIWKKINILEDQVSFVPLVSTNRVKGNIDKIKKEVDDLKQNLLEKEKEVSYQDESIFEITANYFTITGSPSLKNNKSDDNEVLVVENIEEYRKKEQELMCRWENAAKQDNKKLLNEIKSKINSFKIFNRDIIKLEEEYDNLKKYSNYFFKYINELSANEQEKSELLETQRAQQVSQTQRLDVLESESNELEDDTKLIEYIKKQNLQEGLYEVSTSSGNISRLESQVEKKEEIKVGKNKNKNKKKREKKKNKKNIDNILVKNDNIKLENQNVEENLEVVKLLMGPQIYNKIKNDYKNGKFCDLLEKKYEEKGELMAQLYQKVMFNE
jgi:chromosome segregation ATPase